VPKVNVPDHGVEADVTTADVWVREVVVQVGHDTVATPVTVLVTMGDVPLTAVIAPPPEVFSNTRLTPLPATRRVFRVPVPVPEVPSSRIETMFAQLNV
jgi:hypothetical protein